jgi:putative flippase GtrA
MVFAVIGVINTLVDFVILNILLPIGPLKAKVIATVVATTASYVMNRYWTYAHRERTSARREYVLFFALNLIGLAIQLAVLGLAKYGLHYSEDGTLVDRIAFNVANAVGTGLAMVFRFWSYRTFVFKARTAEPATTDPATAEPVTTEPVTTEAVAAAVAVSPVEPADAAVPVAPAQRAAGLPAADHTNLEFAELTAPLEAELDGTAPAVIDLPVLPGEPTGQRH